MTWEIRPSGFTAVRDDGAKVGAFWPNGRMEWWGYTPDKIPSGPHQSMAEAQAAVDSAAPDAAMPRKGPPEGRQEEAGL